MYVCIVSADLGIWSWVCHLVLCVLRVLCVADFELQLVTIETKEEVCFLNNVFRNNFTHLLGMSGKCCGVEWRYFWWSLRSLNIFFIVTYKYFIPSYSHILKYLFFTLFLIVDIFFQNFMHFKSSLLNNFITKVQKIKKIPHIEYIDIPKSIFCTSKRIKK